MLPTFLLCGAQKAGTTAIHEALCDHPDVCMSRPKETEFFNWRYHRGWSWFSSHFEHHSGEAAIGEASTRTMPTPNAPARIAKRLPDIQLIFVLRNPIERAHSAFWYYLTQGILCPGEDFGAFIRNEGHPLRQEIIHYGFYEQHLNRFLNHFSRSQCLLLLYDDLRSAPKDSMSRILDFIGVDYIGESDLGREKNVTRYPTSQPAYALGKRLWKPVERMALTLMPALIKRARETGQKWLLKSERPEISQADREYLAEIYETTVYSLSDKFNLCLSEWNMS
jgi:hypothetical protein